MSKKLSNGSLVLVALMLSLLLVSNGGGKPARTPSVPPIKDDVANKNDSSYQIWIRESNID